MGTIDRRGTYSRLVSMKKIGFFGAISLIFNAATGPGLAFTPQNFQSPGLVFTICCFILFAFISGFSILFIIESMQSIPANKHFQGNVEYATLINFYFEPIAHMAGQIMLYGALQSNAIQGIVLSSQAIDRLFIDIFGRTCGVGFSGPAGWICVKENGSLPSPFGNTYMLFTFGLIVVLLCTIPLGLSNLDDNMGVQYVAFVISIMMVIQWITAPFVGKLEFSKLPAIEPIGKTYGDVIGTIMLNFAVTVIIPSWINIKSKEVNVQQAVWGSIGLVAVFYVVPGMLLAAGFKDINGNVLISLLELGKPIILTKITVYLFAFVMLIPAIPVNLLISRENLSQNKVCSRNIATLLTLVLPWIISIPLQTGIVIEAFQTWTSLIFVSTANFMIPVLIFFKCKIFREKYNSDRILSVRQLELLKQIHAASPKILHEISKRHLQISDSEQTLEATEEVPAILIVPPNNNDLVFPSVEQKHDEQDISVPHIFVSDFSENNPEVTEIVVSQASVANSLEEDVPDPDLEDSIAGRETLATRIATTMRRRTHSAPNLNDVNMPVEQQEMAETIPRLLPSRTRLYRKSDTPISYRSSSSAHNFETVETHDSTIKPIDLPFLDVPDPLGYEYDTESSYITRNYHLKHLQTLPANRRFRSPAFRSVPIWMPFRAIHLARFILVVTFTITVGNIILNIVP